MGCRGNRKRHALSPAMALTEPEKPSTRRARPKGFVEKVALFLRCWQLVSALAIYASFSLLFRYIEDHRLGEDVCMFSIVNMSRCVFVYSVLNITTTHIFKQFRLPFWAVFAKISVPGDLLMMAFFIAKTTVLSSAGLPADCHGLTREGYKEGDLARQPRDGFSTIRFGPGVRGKVGELDHLCQIPQAVYALCVVDIFSYTLAIVFTVLRLQRHYRQRQRKLSEKELPTGHVETAVGWPGLQRVSSQDPDVEASLHPGDASRVEMLPTAEELSQSSPRTSLSAVRRSDSVSISETLAESTTTSSIDGTCPTTVRTAETSATTSPSSRHSVRSDSISWRTSQDTVMSAFDPNHYIVSDGFRPSTQPPAYSSRPSSLYSGK